MFLLPYRGTVILTEAKPRLKRINLGGSGWLWQCHGAGLTFIRQDAADAFDVWIHVHVYQLRMIQSGNSPLNTNESLPS